MQTDSTIVKPEIVFTELSEYLYPISVDLYHQLLNLELGLEKTS